MIGIVILNYNDWSNSVKLLESISESPEIKYKIYFVDNCSEPDKKSMEKIEKIAHKVILLNHNSGYSVGNNAGIREARGDGCNFILIANTDVIFSHGTLGILLNRMVSNKYSILAPRVKVSESIYQEVILGVEVDKWGKLLLLLRSSPINYFVRSYSKKFSADDKIHQPWFDVYGVSGCCFLMDARAVSAVTPLDEDIFLYNEEYIIAMKLKNANLFAGVTNEAIVLHLGGQSTNSLRMKSYYFFIISEQILLGKYYSAGKVFRSLFLTVRILRPLLNVLSRKLRLKDYIAFLRMFYE